MKILFFKPNKLYIPYIKEWEEDNDIKVDTIDELISEDNIDRLVDYDGVVFTVANKPTDDMYQQMADFGIKQIALTSVGYEQIDLDEASKAGIVVTNNPAYSPESIAEFTLMIILKAIKKDKQIKENMTNNDFRQNETVLGQTLNGKTVGIYGLGRIGLNVAKLIKPFGARIISHSSREKKEAEGIVEMLDNYDEVLKDADIISIHSALTDENYHFFDKDTFSKMKDGAILINCARGGLLNTSDMLDAIDSGKLSYAALDVYENESPIIGKENPSYDDPILDKLLSHPQVDFYPHISYFTDTSMENQAKFALDAAVDVIKTGDSENRVN